jgi:hypothetical protein
LRASASEAAAHAGSASYAKFFFGAEKSRRAGRIVVAARAPRRAGVDARARPRTKS